MKVKSGLCNTEICVPAYFSVNIGLSNIIILCYWLMLLKSLRPMRWGSTRNRGTFLIYFFTFVAVFCFISWAQKHIVALLSTGYFCSQVNSFQEQFEEMVCTKILKTGFHKLFEKNGFHKLIETMDFTNNLRTRFLQIISENGFSFCK